MLHHIVPIRNHLITIQMARAVDTRSHPLKCTLLEAKVSQLVTRVMTTTDRATKDPLVAKLLVTARQVNMVRTKAMRRKIPHTEERVTAIITDTRNWFQVMDLIRNTTKQK